MSRAAHGFKLGSRLKPAKATDSSRRIQHAPQKGQRPLNTSPFLRHRNRLVGESVLGRTVCHNSTHDMDDTTEIAAVQVLNEQRRLAYSSRGVSRVSRLRERPAGTANRTVAGSSPLLLGGVLAVLPDFVSIADAGVCAHTHLTHDNRRISRDSQDTPRIPGREHRSRRYLRPGRQTAQPGHPGQPGWSA